MAVESKFVGVPTTRIRPFGVRAGRGSKSSWFVPSTGVNAGTRINYSKASGEYKFAGIQYTESEGHPFHSSNRKGLADLGGNFHTQKTSYEFAGDAELEASVRVTGTNPGRSYYTYSGPLLAVNPASIPLPPNAYSNDVALDALGATAISQVKPTNPVAGLTAALAELRGGKLPHLPGSQSNWASRTEAVRSAGDEYLNAQFGWLPLVNDITDFTSGVTHAQSVIERYKRGIGKPIRRTFHFPTVRESKEEIISTSARPFGVYGGGTWMFSATGSSPGYLVRKYEVLREQWFSGCFTYFFPSDILGSKKLADLAILGKQLGLYPTPDVVWQVAPWSWAVDWFSNTGDVISNWSSFQTDGLVLRYGYMMEHSIAKYTYSLVGARAVNGASMPISNVTRIIETKRRRKANPYGFGVSWDGLTSFQSSILAALGMSRVGR